MLKNVIASMIAAARSLWRNKPALATFFALFAALLAAIYLFVVTREATIWQLLVTLVAGLAAPVLFFVLQAMSVSYRRGEASLGVLLRGSWRACWKLLLVSVPVALLAWLIVYLFSQVELQAAGAVREAARFTPAAPRPPARSEAQPGQWLTVIITAARFLLLYIVLPLAAIHLWIAAARDGLGAALKGIGRVMARAFAPRSVLTYAIGLVLFGVIPYFLIFTRTPVKNAWIEAGLLGARLTLAAVLTLFGWVLTLGALAEPTAESAGRAEMEPEHT
jgi:hypothetical protein